jgi:hypothetical protein
MPNRMTHWLISLLPFVAVFLIIVLSLDRLAACTVPPVPVLVAWGLGAFIGYILMNDFRQAILADRALIQMLIHWLIILMTPQAVLNQDPPILSQRLQRRRGASPTELFS